MLLRAVMFRALFIVLCLLTHSQTQDEELVHIGGVIGSQVEVPCSMSPTEPSDNVQLVLWYKGGSQEPIYSFDARDRPVKEGIRWADEKAFSGRASFHFRNSKMGVLQIKDIKDKDQGVYRCRVDYETSQTSNFRANLTVIFPPTVPTILDSSGEELLSVEPLHEGDQLELVCEVYEGRPLPSLVWLRNEKVLSADYHITQQGFVRNVLRIEALQREDNLANLTCVASNYDRTSARSKSIVIQMILKPLEAHILGADAPLTAGEKYEFRCRSIGSYPTPQFSWWVDDQWFSGSNKKEMNQGNITESLLYYTPEKEEDGTTVSCLVENPKIKGSKLKEETKIIVYYAPVVHLRVKGPQDPSAVNEGDSLIFNCETDSNPHPTSIQWLHNGSQLKQSNKGFTIRRDSLTVLDSTRKMAGDYICRATNSIGVGESQKLTISITHAPVCHRNDTDRVTVPLGDSKSLICKVDAQPPTSHFRWARKKGNSFEELPVILYNEGMGESVLNFDTGRKDSLKYLKYGTFYCWGKNSIGTQEDPCVFIVTKGEPPRRPINCFVLKKKPSIILQCDINTIGTQPDHFVLEVYQEETLKLVANKTVHVRPMFYLNELVQRRAYEFRVYAVNENGRSPEVRIQHYTEPHVSERKSDVDTESSGRTEMWIFIIATVGVLIIVMIVIILTSLFAWRRRKKRKEKTRRTEPPEKLLTSGGSSETDDDKNPDIIPDAADTRASSTLETISSICDNLSPVTPETAPLVKLPLRASQPPPKITICEPLLVPPDIPMPNINVYSDCKYGTVRGRPSPDLSDAGESHTSSRLESSV